MHLIPHIYVKSNKDLQVTTGNLIHNKTPTGLIVGKYTKKNSADMIVKNTHTVTRVMPS